MSVSQYGIGPAPLQLGIKLGSCFLCSKQHAMRHGPVLYSWLCQGQIIAPEMDPRRSTSGIQEPPSDNLGQAQWGNLATVALHSAMAAAKSVEEHDLSHQSQILCLSVETRFRGQVCIYGTETLVIYYSISKQVSKHRFENQQSTRTVPLRPNRTSRHKPRAPQSQP